MKDRMSSEEESNLSVSNEILKSTNISIEELRRQFIDLKSILGTRFDYVVPRNITDLATLQWIIDLNQRLQKLKHCKGFDKHITTYTKKQLSSSYFVTVIASYLLDMVDSIILEPALDSKSNKPDILVSFQSEQVYMECKYIDTLKFDYSQEHEHMFSILRDYVTVPHQISITYRKPLSDTELHRLGETLRERTDLVTGDGNIINNSDIEVNVMKMEVYQDKNFFIILSMIVQNISENCYYPGHVYVKDGITVSLSGPKVDYAKVLKERFKKSKSQSPDNKPYILVIDGNRMLGDLTENIRALSSSFQPNTNTRFSAALLVKYHRRLDDQQLNLDFHLISNPFAKFPISKEFERLFSNSTQSKRHSPTDKTTDTL